MINNVLRMKRGDLILLPKNHAHRYRSHQTQPWSIYWLHFDGSFSDEFCKNILVQHASLIQVDIQPWLIRIFESLFALHASAFQLDRFIHGSHELRLILSFISMQQKVHSSRSNNNIDIERVRTFLLSRIHGHLNLDELAADSLLSKFHFSKCFKQLTRQSSIQFFIHLKMEQA